MAKSSKAVTIRMDSDIYDRLSKYCDDSGQSKTGAIERAVSQFIDAYEDRARILQEATRNGGTRGTV